MPTIIDCFNPESGNNEAKPLLIKELPAGECIYPPRTLLRELTPITVGIIPSSMAALAFYIYSDQFWNPLLGDIGAKLAGNASFFPITILSANSVGKVLNHIISHPRDFFKNLATLGLVDPILWNRKMDSKLKWVTLQVASGALGLVDAFATVFSVIASNALNYTKSKTWISTGPNTVTSFMMNKYYLSNVFDLMRYKLAARLGDTNQSYRKSLLCLLNGLKTELPIYAQQNPIVFLKWLDKYKNLSTELDQLTALIKLQRKIGIGNKASYKSNLSIIGFLMLIPAFVFTLPLFRAGANAQITFQDYNNFIEATMTWMVNTFPWWSFSAGSMLCNFAINGLNGYEFGSSIGSFFNALQRKEAADHLGLMRGFEFAFICIAVLFAAFAMGAQMGAAYFNPLGPAILTFEVFAVGLAALALYFRSVNERLKHFTSLYDRYSLHNINTFLEHYRKLDTEEEKINYIKKLTEYLTNSHISPLEIAVQKAAYKKASPATRINIETIVAVPIIEGAMQALPSSSSSLLSSWCSYFKYPEKNTTNNINLSDKFQALPQAR